MSPRYWPVAAAVAGLACATVAKADPPPNADPALAPWYQGLKQPNDRHLVLLDRRGATDYRTDGDHYEVLINDKWTIVPKDKVLQHVDNPIGRAVVCWTPALGIMCFVRATEI